MPNVITKSPKTTLKVGDRVRFVIKGKNYDGEVHYFGGIYHVHFPERWNHAVLVAALGCEGYELERRVADIYGEEGGSGYWPETTDLEALTRLVRAVFARCDPPEEPKEEKVADQDVPELAEGQIWQTRDGKIVEIRDDGGDGEFGAFLLVGESWLTQYWYKSHQRCKTCHTPGKFELGSQPLLELVRLLGYTVDAKSKEKKVTPIFKVGEVWKTRGGYLIRFEKFDELGALFRVIHAPEGKAWVEGICGIHPNENDDLTLVEKV